MTSAQENAEDLNAKEFSDALVKAKNQEAQEQRRQRKIKKCQIDLAHFHNA